MVYGYRRANLNAVWVLIGACVIVFIATTISPDLIYLLGLSRFDLASKPWTLITNIFVHGGIGHIFTNMLTLYFFGTYLCTLMGEKRFLIVYFVGGLVGNIFYILLASPFSLAVGASGAIFALGGVLAVMRPNLRVFVFPVPAPIPLWLAVIGGFIIISFFPNIAWQAHLGGLVFGLVVGYFFKRRERGRPAWY
jgi:membrane associated rhomboid family serine protease